MTKKIFLVAIFSLMIGFCTGNLLMDGMNKMNEAESSSVLSANDTFENYEQEDTNDMYDSLMNTINPGGMFFLKHNITFFLLMSVLPVINVAIMIIQIIITGLDIGFIQEFSFNTQFIFLYRHLFFEFIALIVAVSLGNKFLMAINMVIAKEEIKKRKLLFEVAISYALIIICTVIAAALEGSAHV